MSESTKPTSDDVTELIAQLTKRIESLEAQVKELTAEKPIPDDVIVAIGAAVSAYLGNKAKVRAVHLRGSHSWATEERAFVHDRAVRRR